MAGFKDEAVVKNSNEFTSKYVKAYGEPPDLFGTPAYFSVVEHETVFAVPNTSEM
jgi:hypothetical protein